MWKARKYELAAKIILILGIGVNAYQLNNINDFIHLIDLVWFLSLVLFAYFVLSSFWGVLSLITFAAAVIYFIQFKLNDNLITVGQIDASVKIFLIANSVISVVILGYLLNYYTKFIKNAKDKLTDSNFNLQAKNEIIENQNTLKTVMLKEIHHRVKNNLQIITSFLRLQSHHLNDSDSKEHFNEAISRIHAMSLIHEKLYKQDLTKVNLEEYFVSLGEVLTTNYRDQNIIVSIKVKIILDYIDIETLIPIGLLFNELCLNSIKYAFEETKKGEITFVMNETENEFITLEYKDNGKWKKPSDSEAFGLEMVQILTEQLDGTFERNTKNGTEYLFSFKKV